MTKVLHFKHIYKEYVGVDACAADLMRPAVYGAYLFVGYLFINCWFLHKPTPEEERMFFSKRKKPPCGTTTSPPPERRTPPVRRRWT